jgi:hypothetical protein
MGDISLLMPAVHAFGSGGAGAAHGPTYHIADFDSACMDSAKAQVMIVRKLLENNAVKAKYVIENANQWIHVDYCNCKDGVKRYFLEVSRVIPWGEIYFSHGDDTIKAWKEDFEKQPVSEECDFAIKTVACFNDKLLIFGENNEFAIGEISVLSPEQAKPDHSAQSTKTKSPQISPEEALLNSMQNMSKRLEELNKLF